MSSQHEQFLKSGGKNWGCLGCLGLIGVMVVVGLFAWGAQSFASAPHGACEVAMQAAADATSEAEAERHLVTTADECGDVDTWESALMKFPGAMGLDDPNAVDPKYDLAGICVKYPETNVCKDAATLGLDENWN